MNGPTLKVCPDCLGACRMTVTDPDADGGRAIVDCEGCGAEGRLILCEEPLCGELILLAEAAREGAFCAACRDKLDISDAEAEAIRLRRAS